MLAAGALFTQNPAALQVGKSPGQLVVSRQGICPAPVPLQAAPRASTNPQPSVRKSLRRIGVWIIRSTQSAQAPPCEAAPGAQEPEIQKAKRNAETPAAARPPAKPMTLSVLFCFSESSSDFAVAPSWTEPVRSFWALDALVYAKTPPPRAPAAAWPPRASLHSMALPPPVQASTTTQLRAGRGARAPVRSSSQGQSSLQARPVRAEGEVVAPACPGRATGTPPRPACPSGPLAEREAPAPWFHPPALRGRRSLPSRAPRWPGAPADRRGRPRTACAPRPCCPGGRTRRRCRSGTRR